MTKWSSWRDIEAFFLLFYHKLCHLTADLTYYLAVLLLIETTPVHDLFLVFYHMIKKTTDISHLATVLIRIHFWLSNACQGLYLALRIQFALHLIQCLSPSNRTGCLPRRLLIGIECTVIFSNINQYSPNLPQHIFDAHYCPVVVWSTSETVKRLTQFVQWD